MRALARSRSPRPPRAPASPALRLFIITATNLDTLKVGKEGSLTGSGRLVLFERRMHDRLPVLSHHGQLVMYQLSGESRLDRVILPHLEVGGSIIDRLEGFLSDASVEHYPATIDGVLGLRSLAAKHADFDFERNRLGFD
jgi:hypothetical protein